MYGDSETLHSYSQNKVANAKYLILPYVIVLVTIQESGVRSQESGVRSQESGVRMKREPAKHFQDGIVLSACLPVPVRTPTGKLKNAGKISYH
jgi:hypothetical protein